MPWMRMKGSATNWRGDHFPVALVKVDSMWPLTGETDISSLGPIHSSSIEATERRAIISPSRILKPTLDQSMVLTGGGGKAPIFIFRGGGIEGIEQQPQRSLVCDEDSSLYSRE
jgi:hypothetical protein